MIKRIVSTGFWNDNKVVDSFSPEDKYFMLYLLTNPHTTQLGIYEFNKKIMAFELGYSIEAVTVLLDRFENTYGIIKLSEKTNELAILNFLRHSIVKGGAPVRDCLIKEMKRVKDKNLINIIFAHIKKFENLNETVVNLIAEYEKTNGDIKYSNEKERKEAKERNNKNDNENDNENDNDVSYPESFHDSLDDSFESQFQAKKESQRLSPDKGKAISDDVVNYINQEAGDKNIAEKLLAIFNNRLDRGKSVSIKIAEIFLNNLEDYSEGNYATKIAILDNSILYDAINIFKPKQKEYSYNWGNESEEEENPSYSVEENYDIIEEINWGLKSMSESKREASL